MSAGELICGGLRWCRQMTDTGWYHCARLKRASGVAADGQTLTITGEDAPEDLEAVAPLHFVSLHQGQTVYVALVDPGSMLNLVDLRLLPLLDHSPMRQPPRTKAVKGLSGVEQPIDDWVNIRFRLATGQQVVGAFAVVRHSPSQLLIGLPFLRGIRAMHDTHNQCLRTPQGNIRLFTTKKSPTGVQANTTSTKTSRDKGANTTSAKTGRNGGGRDAVGCDDPCQEVDIDFSQTNIDATQQQQVRELLNEFRGLWEGGRRGQARGVAHRIRLMTTQPIRGKPRPVTAEQQKIIDNEVEKMLAEGVIRPSASPYASEIVLVLKKTGDWRFCVDFRPLNKQTVTDAYPMPRIGDLVNAVKTSRYFVALDLKAGYWQIPLDQDSIKYTAFRCAKGLFEFLVMPFGLKSAPATFQRAMDWLFGDLRFRGVLVYLDDILIHAATFDEALRKTRIALQRLQAAGFTINLPKSAFFPRELHYLGQLIIDGKLYPNPNRVAVLRRWTIPTGVTEVRSLLGFLGYYQTFIPGYAELLEPVFKLLAGHTKKKPKSQQKARSPAFVWTEECSKAVDEVIRRLETSVLQIPEGGQDDKYLLATDASTHAVGATLAVRMGDEWVPVAFHSRRLSPTQQRWPIREQEAFAIVEGLRKFDAYLRGRPFEVHTDHESLQWMLSATKGKVARWASLLAEYDMTVRYVSGTKMQHVDFLSRFLDTDPDPTLAPRMIFDSGFEATATACCQTATTVEGDFGAQRLAAVRPDTRLPSLEDIRKAQEADGCPQGHAYSKTGGLTFYHGLIYVPPALRWRVIAACHNLPPFRHPGVRRTKSMVKRVFNWPHSHADISRYIRSCLACQRIRAGRTRLQGLRSTHPIDAAFGRVYLDFWSCTYDGAPYTVLTMVDSLTKWAEAVIMDDKADASTTASMFLRTWVCRFGVPSVIVTDQGKVFKSTLLNYLCDRLGIRHIYSAVYHPEGNAPIESFHSKLAALLRHHVHEHLPFAEALDLALLSYRATPHTTTLDSPMYLCQGQDPNLGLEADWRFDMPLETKERLRLLQSTRLDVQLHAQLLRQKAVAAANVNRRPLEFEEGQLVLVPAYSEAQVRYKPPAYKLVPKWTMPHRVLTHWNQGRVALVRCLITGRTQQVHVQNTQFLDRPVDAEQAQEWYQLAQCSPEATSLDPAVREVMFRHFIQEITKPAATGKGSRKRQRIDDEARSRDRGED